MKNKFLTLLSVSVCSLSLTNCGGNIESQSNKQIDSSTEQTSKIDESNTESSIEEISSEEVIEKPFNLLGEDFDSCISFDDLKENTIYNWNEEYQGENFTQTEDIMCEQIYKNNVLTDNEIIEVNNDDVKEIFYNKNKQARFVSKADGYCLTMPTDTVLATDFSLGQYRSKLYNQKSTLTITYETSNPYSNWNTYRNEWLLRYLENENFYLQNNLEATRAIRTNDDTILKNYTIDQFDLVINDPGVIEKNYYNIAVVRPKGAVKIFYLLVMKSTENCDEEFDSIIQSFKIIDKEGTANNNSLNDLPNIQNPKWSEETKAYYNKLLTQDRTDWGFFVATLPSGRKTKSQLLAHDAYTKKIALEDAFDYNFEILPTYAHIGWGNSFNNDVWPSSAANFLAGGNGFNGLPVMQMSYQFTNNNNNVNTGNTEDCYTPVFDIYRGADNDDITCKRSKAFYAMKSLALDIKAYEKPVLFRLNNEMNTDWTSYCGLISLLDPDIFQATWRVIYKIFEDTEVDNCIWIFNPIAVSCPYSSWGEALCYYPGVDYVQALGLTYYEFNNDNSANSSSFRTDYTKLYNRYYDGWKNYPWIISEFACGSGGDSSGTLFRNQNSQANYVKGMFDDFNDRENNPYLQNIKGAVWFDCNDYASDGKVVNQLEIVIDKLPLTVAALKEGLSNNK